MKSLDFALEYTLFTVRSNPGKGLGSLLVCIFVNTLLRLATIYLVIRVVLSAINHGSF